MLIQVVEGFARLSALRDVDESSLALAQLAVVLADLDSADVLLSATWRGASRWQAVRPGAAGAQPLRVPHLEPGLPSARLPLENPWLLLDRAGCRVALPLPPQGHRQAVLVVRSARPLVEDQRLLLQALVRCFANQRSLVEENQSDALTGLRNRKTFDETFSRISMALAAQPPASGERRASGALRCWLGVLDIDFFKRINDGHGHLIGDEVLLMLSQLIRQTVRDSDLAYRFGGEEFVVLLKAPGAQAAHRGFERLRQAVARHDFPQVGSITVSIGITGVQADDLPSDAFGRADRALYWVKQNGRNQVADHAALLARGLLEAEVAATSVEFF